MSIESAVRRVVAERLGVSPEELGADVSLRDELAADSLDIVEVAMAIESEFAILLPGKVVEQMRSYGDLVEITKVLVAARRDEEERGAERPIRVWTRIVRSAGEPPASLDWTGWLTPYAVETIEDDALRAGHGARLEVTVGPSTEATLGGIRRQFAGLATRGVLVTVRRQLRAGGTAFPQAAVV